MALYINYTSSNEINLAVASLFWHDIGDATSDSTHWSRVKTVYKTLLGLNHICLQVLCFGLDNVDMLAISLTFLTYYACNIVWFRPFFLSLSDKYAEVNGRVVTFPSQVFGVGGFGTMTGDCIITSDSTMDCTFTYDDGLLINDQCSLTYEFD